LKAGIQTRLLILTTVVLGTFLSLAGLVLDRSFQASVLTNAEEQLRIVIYSLMGAVEDDGTRLFFDGPLPEPRLSQPESGLYAEVTARHGLAAWRSPSAQTSSVNLPETDVSLAAGEFVFFPDEGRISRFLLSYAVIWGDTEDAVLTFTVATDQQPFLAEIQGFRRNLYVGLGAVTIFFVLAQWLAVRVGLRPLRTMAAEVRALEDGERESLSEDYPKELEGLAENLDRFVAHEQRSRSRYRRAMEDLAHSLKTPLAVIRNELGERDGGEREQVARRQLLQEQLDRMETTVTHQLSRAAVSGPVVVGKSVNVYDLVERLRRALETAYAERGVEFVNELPADLAVRADERDVLEMLGNLLENAFKYTGSRIEIRALPADGVCIEIADDGPGIKAELRSEVLNRGTRADQVQPGQGIGLAMVQDLLEAYSGHLEIADSPLGGASIRLVLG
jgi:two-component system sensor histidine kinase PhoQ